MTRYNATIYGNIAFTAEEEEEANTEEALYNSVYSQKDRTRKEVATLFDKHMSAELIIDGIRIPATIEWRQQISIALERGTKKMVTPAGDMLYLDQVSAKRMLESIDTYRDSCDSFYYDICERLQKADTNKSIEDIDITTLWPSV